MSHYAKQPMQARSDNHLSGGCGGFLHHGNTPEKESTSEETNEIAKVLNSVFLSLQRP
jgi:hypothetical protein